MAPLLAKSQTADQHSKRQRFGPSSLYRLDSIQGQALPESSGDQQGSIGEQGVRRTWLRCLGSPQLEKLLVSFGDQQGLVGELVA